MSASAVGIYGDRGDEALDEDSAPGEGFLADVCRQWERAADPARDATRVVHPRIGVVLARSGGALERMLPVFKLGAGGKLGSGRQWTSWISMDDVVGALVHLIDAALEGPVNVTAPTPVTNADFTRALGEAVRRPTFLPAPGFALKLALGEMADEMLLASTRALPKRLLDDGYVFRHPELPPALRAA